MEKTAKVSSMSKTRKLAGMALFTALVIILQLLGSFIRFGPFSISLVLVPIVLGTAIYGLEAGVWLGFVFGAVVLLSGDAAAFFTINIAGTIVTCLAKGILSGLCAGLIYRDFSKKSETLGIALAAVVCPVVNTGVFLIGCRIFFMEAIVAWAEAAGFDDVGTYMITGFVGINFLIELAVNVILSPMIARLIHIFKKME